MPEDIDFPSNSQVYYGYKPLNMEYIPPPVNIGSNNTDPLIYSDNLYSASENPSQININSDVNYTNNTSNNINSKDDHNAQRSDIISHGDAESIINFDVKQFEAQNKRQRLTYSQVLKILKDLDQNRLFDNNDTYESMINFADSLTTSGGNAGGINVSAYVMQITNDIIIGNSANML